ncbi:hypothetical protein [Aeromicrobium sp. CTD01-1L150]|uniref:hypothetical protein n=1 Tax=Aeromicrobium sp. CTD01-1L150 TaxID=3341830 RepID=UPI0035C1F03E
MTPQEAHHDQQSITAPSGHEHAWCVESSHPTSTGRVLYVHCSRCGVRRVDLQEHTLVPPVALSRELPGSLLLAELAAGADSIHGA